MNTLFLASTVVTGFAAGGLISLLVWLLIAALVIWCVYLVIGMLPLPAPIKQIVCVILGLIFLLIILSHLGILV